MSESLILMAPLAGWSTALDEAPDAVFAGRMIGDGVAIDPVSGTLCAPCAGEVTVVAAARHAVTLRTAQGCEILLHVGIETVALAGEGFQAHVQPGAEVRTGDPLLSFDLDLLAQRAPSLLTPVIVTADSGFRIKRRVLDRELALGDVLMELEPVSTASVAQAQTSAQRLRRHFTVHFEHGLHARPAARLAASLKNLNAEVRIEAHGRDANARSTVALMALGVGRDDRIEVSAQGAEAQTALDRLAEVLAAAEPGGPERILASHTPTASAAPAAHASSGTLTGVVASPGFALGSAVQLRRPEIAVTENGRGARAEADDLQRARAEVRTRLERREGQPETDAQAARTERGIAAAHLELLDDPELVETAGAAITAGKSASFAWRAAVRASAAALSALPDPRMRERVDDLLDLETQVLLALRGGDGPALVPELPAHAIVIAHELLPSQLVALDRSRLEGICMAAGGPTSHASILAAAMGIPALVALGPQVLQISPGTVLLLDTASAALEVDPAPARQAAANEEIGRRQRRRAALAEAARGDCRTADGVRIAVLANIGSLPEARAAIENGAEGCGLLRTEFLFLDRQIAPSEAEQTTAYAQIAEVLGERVLTIRTLDAGGDKPIAYLPSPAEENPALGMRGVRTSLAWPQLMRTQLRAVLGVPSAHCRILLPMITDLEEITRVRALLDEERRALGRREPIALGVMIETPASALLADRMLTIADFISIGTNDLTQYTLAMDRGHPQLAARLDALHPAVLRLIAQSAEASHAAGRHAAVCGGLASVPLAAPLLIGLGVQELSAVPAVIPELKDRIRSVTSSECRALAQRALGETSAAAVRRLLA